MPKVFYSAKLYPFMDKVLALIRQAATAFYLTGGTALGRHNAIAIQEAYHVFLRRIPSRGGNVQLNKRPQWTLFSWYKKL